MCIRDSIEGDEEAKEPVKQMFVDLIKEKYDVEEEDFLSAEIEVVPAGPARDMGLDRSMILGHGQDDRVCAYTSLMAQLDVELVETTSVTLLVDKEEIGSVGASGMTSRFFENTVAEIMALAGEDSPLALRRALANSRMLSSDVSAGFDHLYADRFEKKNAAVMGHGLCFNKYTGSRGKGDVYKRQKGGRFRSSSPGRCRHTFLSWPISLGTCRPFVIASYLSFAGRRTAARISAPRGRDVGYGQS